MRSGAQVQGQRPQEHQPNSNITHTFGSVRIKTLVTVLAIRIKSNPPSVLCYDVEHGLVLMGDFGKLLS